jgi:hypothetical protein
LVLYSSGSPSLIPESKDSVFNQTILANTDMFASDLEPTEAPTTFRIYACFTVGGTLTVRRTVGATTVSENLNGGAALVANSSYFFDVAVQYGESINIWYSVGATCLSLKVWEVKGVIS